MEAPRRWNCRAPAQPASSATSPRYAARRAARPAPRHDPDQGGQVTGQSALNPHDRFGLNQRSAVFPPTGSPQVWPEPTQHRLARYPQKDADAMANMTGDIDLTVHTGLFTTTTGTNTMGRAIEVDNTNGNTNTTSRPGTSTSRLWSLFPSRLRDALRVVRPLLGFPPFGFRTGTWTSWETAGPSTPPTTTRRNGC
jgi:hypothetical protein